MARSHFDNHHVRGKGGDLPGVELAVAENTGDAGAARLALQDGLDEVGKPLLAFMQNDAQLPVHQRLHDVHQDLNSGIMCTTAQL
jgi:hypothetical protein